MIIVSVIVATYKRDTSLKEALESLANQTYRDIEIVLVDDNGRNEWSDKVASIVADFKKQFPNVVLNHIVNEHNQGSAKTRNIGVAAAEGKYVTFLDDDDVYLPDKVKRQAEFMENGDYDYSITDLFLYNESGKVIDKRIRSYITDTSIDCLRKYHLKYHMTGTDSMMFKKEYLHRIGGFAPIDVGDEFYLMQRAIDGEGKFGYLDGCDIKAYVHEGDGGLSSGDGKIKGENELYEFKKTFFDKMTAEDIRYIKVRHYAVIAYAELRRKNYAGFMKNSFKSFFSSPVDCVKVFVGSK